MKAGLQHLQDADLVERFRQLALDKSRYLIESNTQPLRRNFDDMKAIEQDLRRRGPESRKALSVLLDDTDMRVRYEAAIRLLAVVPDKAFATVQAIAKRHLMPVSAEAAIFLDGLESGEYKPE